METGRDALQAAIAALESSRELLGPDVVDLAVGALRSDLDSDEPASHRDERRLVTLLLADVVGFTELSERMDPEDLRDRMNLLWDRVDAILLEHGAHIDKHIGDAVIALFGVPTARENDAERAVRAALRIQESLAEAAVTAGAEPLRMRVGVHTDFVVVTPSGHRDGWTAIGDGVDVVASMERGAEVGGVLVSESTWRQAAERFRGDEAREVALAGGGVMSAVPVLSRRRSAPRVATTPPLPGATPFVGREDVLGALLAGLEDVRIQRRPRYFTLLGEPGIGKTRLLGELAARVKSLGWPVETRFARGTPETERTPLAMVRDWLLARTFVPEGVPADEARARVLEALPRVDERVERLLSRLFGPADSAAKPAAGSREELFGAAADLFEGDVRHTGRPLLLMLDDLHWFDDTSLAVAVHLAARVGDLPVLGIFSSRPGLLERQPEWLETFQPHRLLRLGPLPPAPSRDLFESVVGTAVAPAVVRRAIEVAGGNPLFLEELGRQVVAEPTRSHLDVPTTLEALLQARLDRLASEPRRVLLAAAVAGRRVPLALLEALVPGTDVNEALRVLFAHDLLYDEGEEPPVFGFRSDAVRQAAYQRVLRRDARQWHRTTAEWLTAHASGTAAENLAELAEHWMRAQCPDRAAVEFDRAAELAFRSFAPKLAIECYTRALEGLPAGREPVLLRLATLGRLARTQAVTGALGEADRTYRALVEEAAAAGDPGYQGRGVLGQAISATHTGAIEEALSLATEALRVCTDAPVEEDGRPPREGARFVVGTAWEVIATCRSLRGDHRGAAAAADEVLAAAARVPDPVLRAELESRMLRVAATSAILTGELDRGAELLARARALCSEENPWQSVYLSLREGELLEIRGQLDSARKRYHEAIELAERIGERVFARSATVNLARVTVALGDSESAEQALVTILEEAPQSFLVLPEGLALVSLCRAHAGHREAARRSASAALAQLGGETSVEQWVRAYRTVGETLTAAGGTAQDGETEVDARACFERALRRVESTDLGPDRVACLRALARWEIAAGNLSRAAELGREADALAGRVGMMSPAS